MVQQNPHGLSYNFDCEVRDGVITEIAASDDGWFKDPIFEAVITLEKADVSEILQRREQCKDASWSPAKVTGPISVSSH